jgi:hypothetical protein
MRSPWERMLRGRHMDDSLASDQRCQACGTEIAWQVDERHDDDGACYCRDCWEDGAVIRSKAERLQQWIESRRNQ